MKVKVPHMKIVKDQKRKKNRKVERSGRHTLEVREKLRIEEKRDLVTLKISKNQYFCKWLYSTKLASLQSPKLNI